MSTMSTISTMSTMDQLIAYMALLLHTVAIAASIVGALYGMAKQNPIVALVGIILAVILVLAL